MKDLNQNGIRMWMCYLVAIFALFLGLPLWTVSGQSSQNDLYLLAPQNYIDEVISELAKNNIAVNLSYANLDNTVLALAWSEEGHFIIFETADTQLSSTLLYRQYNDFMETKENLDVHYDPTLDNETREKLATNTIVALTLYGLNRCDIAQPYFDLALANAGNPPSLVPDLPNGVKVWGSSYPYVTPVLEFYKGNCALKMGEYENAASNFEASIATDYRPKSIDTGTPGIFSNSTTAINLAWTYIQLGKQLEAFNLLGDFIQNSPFDFGKANLLSGRAQLYALAERYDDAINDLNSAIELDPENPELYILRGQTYLYLYEWDNVLADYNKAIELDPTYADAYFLRGVLYYSILQTGAEHYPDALADFQHYLELAPDGEHAADAQKYADQIQTQQDALNS